MMKRENLVSLLIKLSPRTTEIFLGENYQEGQVAQNFGNSVIVLASVLRELFWKIVCGDVTVFDCFALRISSGIVLFQWRTQKLFMGGFIQRHRVVICIWCALFVTSQNDVIVLFPNQRFGEVC